MTINYDAIVALTSNESTEENSGGQPPHIYKIVLWIQCINNPVATQRNHYTRDTNENVFVKIVRVSSA